MSLDKNLFSKEEKLNVFPYKGFLIFFMALKEILDNYLNYRQYKRLKENRPIPKELLALGLEQKNHEESNKYSKAKLEYLIISNLIKNTFELFLIYFEFYPIEYNFSKKLCVYIPLFNFNPDNEYGPLFVFVSLELIREEVISIPFEIYKTFVLEEKFGFNKTTVSTFIKDQIKTVILFLITLIPIISLLVYIIIKGGKYFYIFTEIFCVLLVFVFMWVYPNFIQPLFNKFKELENVELKESIFNLAKRLDYPLKKIYEMDASQRSSHSNAYLFGIGKNKRIVLFDTLIKNLETKQIVSVLGHELGHWKKWHFVFNLLFTFSLFFILFYLLQFFINESAIFISFGFEQKTVLMGLFLYFQIFSPVLYFINIFQFFMSRKFEYQADNFACELGYGEELKLALAKLSEENKSNLDPDPLYSMMNYTHPTLIERVRAINVYLDNSRNKKEN